MKNAAVRLYNRETDAIPGQRHQSPSAAQRGGWLRGLSLKQAERPEGRPLIAAQWAYSPVSSAR